MFVIRLKSTGKYIGYRHYDMVGREASQAWIYKGLDEVANDKELAEEIFKTDQFEVCPLIIGDPIQ